MSKTLDFTVYLSPEAQEFQPEYVGQAVRMVRENLREHYSIEASFRVLPVPDSVEWVVQMTSPPPDLDILHTHYSSYLTDEGFVCVIVGEQSGEDCGVSRLNKPHMVVTPETPSLGQTILHELGHCCGAEHVASISSLMHEKSGVRTQDASWDAESKAVVSRGLARYARY